MCVYSSICQKKGLSVRRYCAVTTCTKLCFTGMPFFKVWVAASLMILVVFLLTTSWWIVWYLYEKYLTFFLLFTTIMGYYIKWYHSSGEILITIFILHKYLPFWIFGCLQTGENWSGENCKHNQKSVLFSSDYVYLLYYCHCFFQIANLIIFCQKTL